MKRLTFLLLLISQAMPHCISAQLRLTVDGGFAVASFNKKPVLPASTQAIFGLADDQTYRIEPVESGYVALGMAHQRSVDSWGWSTRLQYMKRGYIFLLDPSPTGSPRSGSPAQSYVSFIDLMAQATKTIFGKIQVNAGPYLSFAFHDLKNPTLNLNGPDTVPYTKTDYGINAGISYPFGRLSVTADYQLGLRRHNTASLNEAYIRASGISSATVLTTNPRISALRLGLEYAIWE